MHLILARLTDEEIAYKAGQVIGVLVVVAIAAVIYQRFKNSKK
jgi:hypothetical protein